MHKLSKFVLRVKNLWFQIHSPAPTLSVNNSGNDSRFGNYQQIDFVRDVRQHIFRNFVSGFMMADFNSSQ